MPTTGNPRGAKPPNFASAQPKFARADNDYVPFAQQTEFAFDLVNQIRNFVSDTTSAVAAEVRKIFAHLGCIYAGQRGEFITRKSQNICRMQII